MAAITPVTATPPAEGVEPWYGPRTTFDDQLKSTANAAAEKADAVEAALPAKADVSALAGKISTTEKGAASGVATLGADSKLPAAQLPAIAITEFLGASANQAAMLAKVGQQGDWTIRTDSGTVWVITGATPTQLASWTELGYPTSPVTSVNSKTGIVVLAPIDIGAAAAGDLNNVNTKVDDALAQLGGLSIVRVTAATLPAPGDQLPNTLYFVQG